MYAMTQDASKIAINIQKAKANLSKLIGFINEKSSKYPGSEGDIYKILLPIINLIDEKFGAIYKVCLRYDESIVEDFLSKVSQNTPIVNRLNEDSANALLRLGYALLIEYSFLLGNSDDAEIDQVLYDTRIALNNSESAHVFDLSDIAYSYPYKVLKRYMSGREVQEMLQMPKKIDKAREDARSIEIEANKIEKLFEKMNNLWVDVKRHYHTAVLVEGFSQMRDDKVKEKKDVECSNFLLGGLMIALPVFQIFIFIFLGDTDFAKGYVDRIAYIAPPLIAMELVIFYFFRISLSNYKSINAQILQIDLRIALSQFFKGYQDYNKNLDNKERSGLEKFESMIFSGIAPNDAGIPTTFDGMGEIAKIIEAVKK